VVQNLLADPMARMTLGEEARRYAETWASKRMAERLAALYTRLVARATPGYPLATKGEAPAL
jgi:hypothetical protein